MVVVRKWLNFRSYDHHYTTFIIIIIIIHIEPLAPLIGSVCVSLLAGISSLIILIHPSILQPSIASCNQPTAVSLSWMSWSYRHYHPSPFKTTRTTRASNNDKKK